MGDTVQERTAPPAEPPPLTIDGLRALIRRALTGPQGRPTRLRMPSAEALGDLVEIINFWSARVREVKAEAEWNDICRQAENAAATLRRVLPGIIERMETEARAVPAWTTFAEINLDRVKNLDAALRDFALPLPKIWRAPGVRDRETPNWAHFACAIFADLEKMFGRRLALHDTGPAARLMAAILKHITGETITAATVATMLRKIRKEHGLTD